MILKKWNYKTENYDSHTIPDEWKVSVYESDIDTNINCASCGKQMTFGEGYTSMQLHTNGGFGYSVCEECYEKEWLIRKANQN